MKNKKILLNIFYVLIVLILVVAIIPFNNGRTILQSLTNQYEASNSENYNKLKIVSADIVSRKTGTSPFNTPDRTSVDDGSILSNDDGVDVSNQDDYVRTYDSFTYEIEVGIDRNELTTDESFYTTGGRIMIEVTPGSSDYYYLAKQEWMQGYYTNSSGVTSFYYDIPDNRSPIGGLQNLTFSFSARGKKTVLDDSLKPTIRFWMYGNTESNTNQVSPKEVKDNSNIIISGKESLTMSFKQGNINYKDIKDGVSGNYINLGVYVKMKQPYSYISSSNFRGVLYPSYDVISKLKYTYMYRNVDTDNEFKILDDSTEEGARVLNGIKFIAAGEVAQPTPGFMPREDLNTFGYDNRNRYDYSAGTVTGQLNNNIITIKNKDYFLNTSIPSEGVILYDGFEMFFPRYDEGNGNYEYKIVFDGIDVTDYKNDDEKEAFTATPQAQVTFNSTVEGNINYVMENDRFEDSDDILIMSASGSRKETSYITLTVNSGPYLGGADTLLTWDCSLGRFYSIRNRYSNNNYQTAVTRYGVLKSNPQNGLVGDAAVNAAVYEDFDWYETETEANSHGIISAIYDDYRDLIGFGASEYLYLTLSPVQVEENIGKSGIIRRKTRLYRDAARTDFISIGYVNYEKGHINSDGKEVKGSPYNVGDTMFFPKYHLSISLYLHDVKDNSKQIYNVQDEYIKYIVHPTILNVVPSLYDDTATITVTGSFSKDFKYVEGSANIEPTSVINVNNRYTSVIWELNNWRLGDPLPDFTFLIEISPYIKNNTSYQFVDCVKGEGIFANRASYAYSGISYEGISESSSVTIINLAGQSIRKKIDKNAIDPNESTDVEDYLFNISQEILTDVNTIQELPKNGDAFGSNFNGSYRMKLSKENDNLTVYYTKSSIDSFNLQTDIHDRIIAKDMDFANDDRWIQLNVGDYIPSDAIAIGTHYDELTTNTDINYGFAFETSGNQVGDKYCMQTFGASDNLTNAIVSDNKCIIVASRKIKGKAFEITADNKYYYRSSYDKLLSNETVILLNDNKEEVARTQTDANGTYSFDNLLRGNYYIKYEINSHFIYTSKSNYTDYNTINSNGLTDPIYNLADLNNTNVVVNKDIGIRRKKYNLITHHLLENTTTKLVEDVTEQYPYDAEYVALPSTSIPNKYEVKSTVGSTSGNIDEDTEVTFYYGLKNAKVIVKYIDKDTNTSIVTDDEYNKRYDDQYSVSPKTFEHYNYDSKEGDESGTLESDQVIVKYFYTKKPATLTVHHYYDGTTNSICDDVIDTNKHHTDPYTTSACTTIPNNYELKNVVGTTNGTINSDSTIVTYYYQKKNSTLTNTITKTGDDTVTVYGNKVKYKVKVTGTITDYIGNGTLTIVDTLPFHINSSTSTLDGGTYNNNNKTIIWTIPINNIDSFNSQNNTINIEKNIEVSYSDLNPKDRSMINRVNSSIVLDNNTDSKETEKTTSIAIKGNIKVRYLDENNNELITDINKEELVGTVFTAEAKEFTGYVLKERPENESVEYTVEDQELIYKYEHIKYNVIIKADNDGGAVEGNEVVFYGEDSTDGKLKIVVNEGYVIKSITINGETITVDNKREIILDRFTNILEDKIIVVEFQELISSPNTDSNSIIKVIAIGLIIITSYFIFKKRKELFNK